MSRPLIAVLVAALVGAVSPIGVAQEVPPEVRYDNHKLVRTMLRSQADLDVMLSISHDHWSESIGMGPVDFRVSPEGLAALDASDVNGDGSVNVLDLIDLLLLFGTSCP